MSVGDALSIDSPRSGMIVITAIHDEGADRIARLEDAERRLAALSQQMPRGRQGKPQNTSSTSPAERSFRPSARTSPTTRTPSSA